MQTTSLRVVEQIQDKIQADGAITPVQSDTGLANVLRMGPRPRFSYTWYDNIKLNQVKNWLIEGAFGAGEISVVVGKPGSGKSVIVTDAACHVAAGRDWHGRKVTRGLVVYFAAERKILTERRMAAIRKHHDIKGISLAVFGGKLDMTGSIDAQALVNQIKLLELERGEKCVWIILDTLTRTFGSGDQNASKDMGRYIQSADVLNHQTGAHITIIHHSPWNEQRGKGAIDLDGAVDASFFVSKVDRTFVLRCDGTNDGEEGPITRFQLESVTLSTDAQGNITIAPVVIAATPEQDIAKLAAKSPTGQQAVAMRSLRHLIDTAPECPPAGSNEFPEDAQIVRRDDWQKQFIRESGDSKPDTATRNFRRAASSLIERELVFESGEWVWAADKRT
jgi:hypothetical protein